MRSQALLPVLLAWQSLAHPTQPQELDSRFGWPDVTTFLEKVADIFPGDAVVEDVCGAITAGEVALSTLFGIPYVENDGCGDTTVIFARGTCDPSNVGVVTGPWFFKSLDSKLQESGQSLAVDGFEYPASVDGYLNGSPGNGLKFAEVIKDKLAGCPNTKLVLGAYSQGGMVVHDAAASLDSDTMSKVSAVVIFGDPYSKQPLDNIDTSKVKIFCHEGDNICENGPIITFAHLNYALDADAAADFVISQTQ
ncbi:cutinase-domain-containing protein [Aspergillus lucknowensis]|uniref:cutinase n=1 Tax=Aspergillus lucknowensis TaxID=176173 RepID=A0ABR4LX81_9EURO